MSAYVEPDGDVCDAGNAGTEGSIEAENCLSMDPGPPSAGADNGGRYGKSGTPE